MLRIEGLLWFGRRSGGVGGKDGREDGTLDALFHKVTNGNLVGLCSIPAFNTKAAPMTRNVQLTGVFMLILSMYETWRTNSWVSRK
jgi:hypothetical protein